MSVEVDVSEYLMANGVGGAVAGEAAWLVRATRMVEAGQPQVAVLAAPGREADLALDGSGARYPAVRILVRGAANGFTEGFAKVQEIGSVLGRGSKVMNGRTYHVLSGLEPEWQGYTRDRGEPEWEIGVQLGVVEN